jgi:hypothetical protein
MREFVALRLLPHASSALTGRLGRAPAQRRSWPFRTMAWAHARRRAAHHDRHRGRRPLDRKLQAAVDGVALRLRGPRAPLHAPGIVLGPRAAADTRACRRLADLGTGRPMRPSARQPIGSVSKVFTAVLVLRFGRARAGRPRRRGARDCGRRLGDRQGRGRNPSCSGTAAEGVPPPDRLRGMRPPSRPGRVDRRRRDPPGPRRTLVAPTVPRPAAVATVCKDAWRFEHPEMLAGRSGGVRPARCLILASFAIAVARARPDNALAGRPKQSRATSAAA